jgi:leucyl-tRNA synthetase
MIDTRETYNAAAIQEKWLPVWQHIDPFRARDDGEWPRRHILDMFPYPSGDLHMGHGEAFAIGDVVARYWFQRGYDVLHPIGWDSFGLPAENAAIKHDAHPADWTYANIETQAASFRRYAVSFDWSRRLHTSDPEYYRWTQWLFLRFYERGLAYRKASPVNWCPNDQTVLANEQVINGRCERCGTVVTKRELTQWYFKITDYADRLIDDMGELEASWPEHVLNMQRNWIGRSEGAYVDFAIEGRSEPVTVFTTRPDTLYGATFFVVAADSALADELCAPERRAEFGAYVEQVSSETEIERLSTDREKTGVFLGRYAVNPVNGERIPVWAADYVLADYGTGAIMAVPAHDPRDLDFARKFGIPVRVVVETGQDDPGETGVATPGDGVLVNSGTLNGLAKAEAIAAYPTTNCRCACLTCGARIWRPRASRRWPPLPIGSTWPVPSVARRPAVTPTRWTRSWTRPGTSCGTARRTATTCLSMSRPLAGGCRWRSTSAAWSTPFCTCCTAGSSSRCCTTWGWSISPSRSPGC